VSDFRTMATAGATTTGKKADRYVECFPPTCPVSEDPHVVGVQVRKDGTASVFFGIVQPP